MCTVGHGNVETGQSSGACVAGGSGSGPPPPPGPPPSGPLSFAK